MTPKDSPVLPRAACPICGKQATVQQRPFCSKRCRDLDLGRWLRGIYRVETDESPNDDRDETG